MASSTPSTCGLRDLVLILSVASAFAGRAVGRRHAASSFTPWDRTVPIDAAGETECEWKAMKVHGKPYKMCIRPYNDHISNVLRVKGTWEDCMPLIRAWRQLAASSSQFFVDAGANIGACTMMMAAAYGNMTLVAFEPNPSNLFYLTRSLLANPDINRRVTLYPIGLGQEVSSFPLYVEPRNAGNSVLGATTHDAQKTATTVRVAPFDADVIHELRQPARLMKMDVQGFEVRLLNGAHKLFGAKQVGCVYFECSADFLQGANTTKRALLDAFARYDYVVSYKCSGCKQQHRLPWWHFYSELFLPHWGHDYLACTPEIHEKMGGAEPGFFGWLKPSFALDILHEIQIWWSPPN